MNEHDSENIAGMLEAFGYRYIEDPNDADIVVMNTCSVREHADKRFFGMLGQFKHRKERKGNDFILAICGCMPQQPRIVELINKQFPWVDIIFGTQSIAEFPGMLREKIITGRKQEVIISDSSDIPEEGDSKRLFHHKALVNITYGCNNFCTYCIVPYTRGREKSRSLDDVTAEIRALSNDGVVEVILLGQNVNSFKDAECNTFPDLIREINKIEGIERIRFMTSHPKDISDELIDCFQTCDKLCHNIHLPVQSGSNIILRRMNRHYDRESYLKIINKLRMVCPDIAISTDIIVGFPGESESQFEDTLSLVNEVGYDNAFTFIYSPRPETPAASFPDQVSDEVKHERFNRLLEAVNISSLEKNMKYEGRIVKVLVDGRSKNNENAWTGRTETFKLVNFNACCDRDLCGTFADVRIIKAKTFSLDGEMVMYDI